MLERFRLPPPHNFASGPTEAPWIRSAMPPASKSSTAKKSIHGWTTGTKRSIIHEEFIGVGGFAEVHKVIAVVYVRADIVLVEIPKNRAGWKAIGAQLICRCLLAKSFDYAAMPRRMTSKTRPTQ
jgi:hypothetical protein